MLQLTAPGDSIQVKIKLPLSKSVANRMLCIRHLAGSAAPLNLPDCEDTRLMQELLQRLQDKKSPDSFDAGDAGTVFRFLTALLANTPGEWKLTGSQRMNSRPNGPLIAALRSLGADIRCDLQEGFSPLSITGKKLQGGNTEMDASLSSQFISALMMIGVTMPDPLVIQLKGTIVSAPYIALTAGLMRMQGAEVIYGGQSVKVIPGSYHCFRPYAEADWSAASYWYALSLLSDNCQITLNGLSHDSLQGDKVVEDIFTELGVDSAWEGNEVQLRRKGAIPRQFIYNFTDCPDLVPAVAIACAGAGVSARLTGLSTLGLKESDRLKAISSGLINLGYNCQPVGNDCLVIGPGPAEMMDNRVSTFRDHRIAMAFAMLATKTGPLLIQDPSVVDKSYPEFWNHLHEAGFGLIYREDTR